MAKYEVRWQGWPSKKGRALVSVTRLAVSGCCRSMDQEKRRNKQNRSGKEEYKTEIEMKKGAR